MNIASPTTPPLDIAALLGSYSLEPKRAGTTLMQKRIGVRITRPGVAPYTYIGNFASEADAMVCAIDHAIATAGPDADGAITLSPRVLP